VCIFSFGIKTKLDSANRFPVRHAHHIGLKAFLLKKTRLKSLVFFVLQSHLLNFLIKFFLETTGIVTVWSETPMGPGWCSFWINMRGKISDLMDKTCPTPSGFFSLLKPFLD
jgi:hypothetical protein